jgi:hypothetical protein
VSTKDQSSTPAPPRKPSKHGFDERPIPDALLGIFLAILATALVLGYLFLNKMVDISRQEDCLLGHRGNCAATASPSTR